MSDVLDRSSATARYEEDFFLWSRQQADALRQAGRAGASNLIDWENVAEEIESLGRSDQRGVRSYARNILTHLLKLRHARRPEPREHWRTEIRGWRDQLEDVLEESPSLESRFPSLAAGEWTRAVRGAHDDLIGAGEKQGAAELEVDSYLFEKLDASHVRDDAYFPDPPQPV